MPGVNKMDLSLTQQHYRLDKCQIHGASLCLHMFWWFRSSLGILTINNHDSKVHGANMGSTWGREELGGPHVGPRTFLSGKVHRVRSKCSCLFALNRQNNEPCRRDFPRYGDTSNDSLPSETLCKHSGLSFVFKYGQSSHWTLCHSCKASSHRGVKIRRNPSQKKNTGLHSKY